MNTVNIVEPKSERPVPSPCISVCALNEEDICLGCFRTGYEISYWGDFDNEKRRSILGECRERSKSHSQFVW